MKGVAWVVFLLVFSSTAYAEIHFSGYIVTNKGETIWADEIRTDDDDVWNVKVIVDGQSISSTINEQDIDKITIVKSNRCYPERVIVYLTDGRDFELDRPNLLGLFDGSSKDGWLGFYKYDPISLELKHNRMSCGQIAEIQIDANKGELKRDSKGNRFPPYYIFSPYTGEKLSFGGYDSKK